MKIEQERASGRCSTREFQGGSYCGIMSAQPRTWAAAGLLEWLTPPIHEARTDDRRCQFQQRFVDIQPSFKADSQLAKACKPSMGSAPPPSDAYPVARYSQRLAWQCGWRCPVVSSAHGNACSHSPCRRATSMVFCGGALPSLQSQKSRPRTSRTSWRRAGSHR